MILKVLVYAYTQRTYLSRQIAKALRENVNFMWLSGGNRPDFQTINEFRGEKMKEVIEEVFSSVLELLVEEGYVKLKNYFVSLICLYRRRVLLVGWIPISRCKISSSVL